MLIDIFEENKRFLSASSFVDNQPPFSPFSMLKCALWTLSHDYNIEKGRGGRNVKLEIEKLACILALLVVTCQQTINESRAKFSVAILITIS